MKAKAFSTPRVLGGVSGQIADQGTLEWKGGRATVLDTQKPLGELIVSRVRVDEGSLAARSKVRATVPADTRLDTTSNHTATHLLHKALKDILGPTVQQAGSLVAPDRLARLHVSPAAER